ncbi:MAG: hypothetical protein FWH48_00305 [Oscillospiraceae bacterium]|nr:hypothetical protein [Oscillospiraceae bacterium]
MKFQKTILCAALAAILCLALYSCQSAQLKESIVIEAGSAVPGVEEFYINPKTAGKYVTDTENIDTKKIGTEPIEIEIGAKKYAATLIIKDTTPPTASPAYAYIFGGSELTPEELVCDIEDMTNVTCSFAEPPDFSGYGWQEASILLADEGNNTAIVESKFYVFELIGELALEAGSPVSLSAKDFVPNYIDIEDGPEISCVLDEKLDFFSVGTYTASLALGDHSAHCAIIVQDTTPPSATPVLAYIFGGGELTPDELVCDVEDMTEVTCSFADPPDFSGYGWKEAKILLTDEGGNTAIVESKFYVFELIGELAIEAGTAEGVSIADFVLNYIEEGGLSLEMPNSINFMVPGDYPVGLKLGEHEFVSLVKIKDTTPPTADTKNCQTYKNKPISPVDFVYNIRDFSAVTARYKTQPDFSAPGTQDVYIILEDAFGNTSEYAAKLLVIEDTTPPKISGELNKRVAVGGTVSYRSGVSVADDCDPNVSLEVDSSAVNLNAPGTYEVIYFATDESGNRVEAKGIITVYAIDMELVNAQADEILAQIISSGMSALEKAKAIYNWVDGKMKYTATNAPREIARRAYDCFTKGSGDCYTYMAGAQVLLTRAGIENRTVQRVSEATTAHYWNLVNVGTGWHHFDVCPTPGNAVTISQRFMFTESQAVSYTKAITARDHYYDYDKSTVPEVVK